jgi:NAD(P)-dependent dehydrogenase (short-subunit alcohol dehydrogenase family)
MKQLEGCVAIVTGGAISMGKVFARTLAAEGANIAIADVADGTKVAAEIASEFGVKAMARTIDVSDESQVSEFVAEVMEVFGKVDILLNNAALFATLPTQPHTDHTVDLWDKVMAVNVRGPFLMAKHITPYMQAAGYGKIINIGSGTANKGMPNMLAYVTSKGAILGFTRALSREVGQFGICVNTLSPGLIESPSVLENPHHLGFTERVIASRAIPRTATPDDLLGALVFLASPASDFVTGQTIAVDGGSVNT